MIPILYTADERRFITNGLGRLTDCTRCVVTEERNGIYECEFDYPISGAHFDEIQIGRIVACTHDDRHDIQPFVIYARSVPDLNGMVTFNAHHISYRLSDVVVMPFAASSVAEALQNISAYSVNANPFTFWTDKTTTAEFKNEVPRIARNMLGGEQNSILDVYGGEYEFDKFTVKLHAHRGQDSGVEIRYSKNLTNLSQTIDDGDTYNAVVPYWLGSEGDLVTLPEKILVFSGAEQELAYLTDQNLVIIRTETDEPIEVPYYVTNAAPMDLTNAFEAMPTIAQLRAAAIARFNSSNAWIPDENLAVDFVPLWQTEEFREYSALQRVSLCDTVSVYYPRAGISAVKQKVVKVIYDVLMDRYDSIELGSAQTSLGRVIQQQIMEDVPTNSMMEAAIQYATELIRGGLGGYVVMTPGANGYPQEILIMDTPDTETAVNVWRFNQGGLGHSSNGYQGPFSDIALTQDGRINANMITVGSLNANLITAGTITDQTGKNSWNLDSGEFTTKQGTIGNFDITSSSLDYLTSSKLIRLSNEGIASTRTYSSGRTVGVAIIDEAIAFLGKSASSGPEDYEPLYYFEIGTGEGYDPWLNFTYGLNRNVYTVDYDSFDMSGRIRCETLDVSGTKSRIVHTENYSDRKQYCYETPSPLFGDIGEAQLDSDGLCYVDIDDIFSETIAEKVEYQVFLQKEDEGDCWVADKQQRYFVIRGTPSLKVAWELKAKQKNYALTRLEPADSNLDEYEIVTDTKNTLLDAYINEQEELLYG